MSTFLNRNPYRRAHRRSLFAGFDPILTAAVGALLVIGTLLVYAATRDWYSANGLDPEYYLKRHVINIVIGVFLAWGTTIIDYRLLRAYTPFIWGLGVLGLILVLIPGIGSEINGARAWIGLPFGFQIQPAEIAKISIIIGISMLLSERSVVTIIAVSGAPTRWIVGLLLVAVIGGFVATKAGVVSEYQLKRLQSFVDPNADTQGAGYQLRQARITVGSGGLLGTGLFDGPQTSGRFVPEQQTDFIFTVAGEQLGFIGSGFIIFLLFIVLMRGFAIARRSTDPYGTLVSTGVVAWFAFQIFENIGMTLGLMPMTGVPLPFLSYGGSSMFANLIGFGLLQNVHASHRG
ncbi:MAG: hypothetical protein RLZZ222_406 [Actinomycetota bacterium]